MNLRPIQRYFSHIKLLMKVVYNGTPFAVEKISPRTGLEPRTT